MLLLGPSPIPNQVMILLGQAAEARDHGVVRRSSAVGCCVVGLSPGQGRLQHSVFRFIDSGQGKFHRSGRVILRQLRVADHRMQFKLSLFVRDRMLQVLHVGIPIRLSRLPPRRHLVAELVTPVA